MESETMNNNRRKDINAIINALQALTERQTLDSLLSDTETVRDDEQEYFDNMPESLQGGDKGSAAEEAASNLDQACDALQEAIDALNTALESLEAATA
jgi:ribonuclease HI